MYNNILKRKSTRKYVDRPLSEEDKKLIKEKIENINPIFDNLSYKIILATKKEVVSNMANDFILFYGKKSEKYGELNCGYMLSQLELFLNEKGFGSCYIGLFKTSKRLPGLDYMLMLAVGYPKSEPYRKSEEEFKRLDMSRVVKADTYDEIKKAIRLSPSANNFQPWLVEGERDLLDVYINKKSALSILAKSFFKMDIGIMLNHIQNAAKYINKEITFIDKELESFKNKKYIMSLEIQNERK